MGIKIIAKNKQAWFNYFIEEKLEAGIVLQGTEVKSIRNGKVSLAESHIVIDQKQEVWICNMNISSYSHGNIHNHKESRKRKLLLHAKEIQKLYHSLKTKGTTLVPLSLYLKKSKVKLEIALGRGKKKYDKRQEMAKRDTERKLRQYQSRHR